MRRSKDDTAETRRRIIDVASTEFRRNGIANVSVNDVMTAAGLTHGGFYRHFESKEQLVAEACDCALTSLVESLEKSARKTDSELATFLENYLSAPHRDNAGDGCALATLGSELARADKQTREAATRGYKQLVAAIERLLPISPESKNKATFIATSIIGTVTVARIVNDRTVSNELLKTVLKQLLIENSKH